MNGPAMPDASIEIGELIDQFYGLPSDPSDLGRFEPVDSVPPPYDKLLDHGAHMTVTVESHYGEKVDVRVHRFAKNQNWYSREITLITHQSKQVVQYGIVRLNTAALSKEVWQQIESQETPLGRVLIEHNVLRKVQLCGLWRFHAGPSLVRLIECDLNQVLYGRTALIYCDSQPAIELLEIVSPV